MRNLSTLSFQLSTSFAGSARYPRNPTFGNLLIADHSANCHRCAPDVLTEPPPIKFETKQPGAAEILQAVSITESIAVSYQLSAMSRVIRCLRQFSHIRKECVRLANEQSHVR